MDADEDGLGSAPLRAREVRGEVLTGPERHRRWSVEDKLRILAQSVAPGSSPSMVCRLHRISSGQLYTWRKQFRMGELTGFTPVMVTADPPVEPVAMPEPPPISAPPSNGAIEVELPSGVRLRVNGMVDEGALRQILSALS
jgi:transposase